MKDCHCICAIHRHFATVECRGEAQTTVTLVGRVAGPREVAMCDPCARWWKESQP